MNEGVVERLVSGFRAVQASTAACCAPDGETGEGQTEDGRIGRGLGDGHGEFVQSEVGKRGVVRFPLVDEVLSTVPWNMAEQSAGLLPL